jgi:ABC-type arginine transport system ATPase subunit
MLKIFISNVMFPNDSFISPFLQLINALEVARNGRPKIIGNELHASTGCVSKIIKSIR